MIQDSGERKKFETGAVRDIQEGKGRCDLLPLDVIADLYESFGSNNVGIMFRHIDDFCQTGNRNELHDAMRFFIFQHKEFEDMETAILELSKHFEEGALKYGEYNWQKGIPTHCYISSAVRHYLKYLRGDDDERHDRAFLWNLACCIWTVMHHPELDDIPHNSGPKDDEHIGNAPTVYKSDDVCATCYYGKYNTGCRGVACDKDKCDMFNGSICKCVHIKDGEICPFFKKEQASK